MLTVATYGTWLHGDERGSVDPEHNAYDTPFLRPHAPRQSFEVSLVRPDSIVLDARSRTVVRRSIDEVARYRGWYIHAANVRTNHMHIVVTASGKPELAMNAFKAYATRRLREAGLLSREQRTWVRHGSTRYLWTMEQLKNACRYVYEGQGPDLPEAE
jgi:REP element-mobilizing transposase RayT